MLYVVFFRMDLCAGDIERIREEYADKLAGLALVAMYLIPLLFLLVVAAVSAQPKRADDHETYVFVEGIIGAGKTTFIGRLKEYLDQYIETIELDEPISTWTGVALPGNTNLFRAFYDDRKKWAFHFQSFVLATRMYQYIRHLTGGTRRGGRRVVIVERSISSSKLFSQVLYKHGDLNNEDYAILQSCANMIHLPPRSLTVYIRTDIPIAMSRIDKRGREGEGKIELAYLTDLHDVHKSTFEHTADLTVDGNVDFSCRDYARILALVLKT